MKPYGSYSPAELETEWQTVCARYDEWKQKGFKLDMSRGKPGPDQLVVSNMLFDMIKSDDDFKCEDGMDCRNYGGLAGLTELRRVFAALLDVPAELVMVGGNSSLNMMFDTMAQGMIHGFSGCKPWLLQEGRKWICLTPGYDRHFGIAEYFGMELINVPLRDDGPDMDMVRELVKDETVKGMFCIPKYSNPSGIVYSDEAVRAIAALEPAAKDFRIIWDNAYAVHGFCDKEDSLLSIYDECLKCGHEDMVFLFTSTSKISFPGAGVAALAASPRNLAELKRRMTLQTIGPDKLNQLRHARAFPTLQAVKEQMKRHAAVLKPKFDIVLDTFDRELAPIGVARWTRPTGGYFISLNVPDGCAKRVVELCKQAGMQLTPAGAPYPYGVDPDDTEIRVAPSYPLVPELQKASELLCVAVKLAALEKMLHKSL